MFVSRFKNPPQGNITFRFQWVTVWVRVPLPVPRRSKFCIACSDFFQKSEFTRFLASPPQIDSASPGFDLVNKKQCAKSLVNTYTIKRQSSLRRLPFYYFPMRISPTTHTAMPIICRKESTSLYSSTPTTSKITANAILATSDAALTFQPTR